MQRIFNESTTRTIRDGKTGQPLTSKTTSEELTLEEVSRQQKIKGNISCSYEKGEYNSFLLLPMPKVFVTNYATYLGSKKTEIVALFRREFVKKEQFKVLPDSLKPNQRVSSPQNKNTRISFFYRHIITSFYCMCCFNIVLFFCRLLFKFHLPNKTQSFHKMLSSQEKLIATQR